MKIKRENVRKFNNEFGKAVKPLMDYLSNNKVFHPHMKVIVDSCRAELMEGVTTFNTIYNNKGEKK